jgi:hypothetical protein
MCAGAGGIYWKYESTLKNGMQELYSVLEQQENYLQ